MIQRILCENCGQLKPQNLEDAAAGWKRRRKVIELYDPMKCDLCYLSLPRGTKAIASTEWRRSGEPRTWETVYGRVVDELAGNPPTV